MKRIRTFFRQDDINFDGTFLIRKAYRAIIIEAGKVLLIKSKKFCEYKFPGGGKEQGERAFDVLSRETLEETGYHLKTRIIPLGSTLEYAKDFEGIYDVFQQFSSYYFCKVHPHPDPIQLSSYEIEYGYEPHWVTLEEAIKNNETVPSNDFIPWKDRDTWMMKYLIEMGLVDENQRLYQQ